MSQPVKIEVKSMTDDLAKAILSIDSAMQGIANSGVKRSTIVVLLKDYLGQSVRKDQIVSVLNGLESLKRVYLTDKKEN